MADVGSTTSAENLDAMDFNEKNMPRQFEDPLRVYNSQFSSITFLKPIVCYRVAVSLNFPKKTLASFPAAFFILLAAATGAGIVTAYFLFCDDGFRRIQ